MKIVLMNTKDRYVHQVQRRMPGLGKLFNKILECLLKRNVDYRSFDEIHIAVVNKHMIRRMNILHRQQSYFPEVLSIFSEDSATILFSYINFLSVFGSDYKEYDFYYCFAHSMLNVLLIDNSLIDNLSSIMSEIILKDITDGCN